MIRALSPEPIRPVVPAASSREGQPQAGFETFLSQASDANAPATDGTETALAGTSSPGTDATVADEAAATRPGAQAESSPTSNAWMRDATTMLASGVSDTTAVGAGLPQDGGPQAGAPSNKPAQNGTRSGDNPQSSLPATKAQGAQTLARRATLVSGSELAHAVAGSAADPDRAYVDDANTSRPDATQVLDGPVHRIANERNDAPVDDAVHADTSIHELVDADMVDPEPRDPNSREAEALDVEPREAIGLEQASPPELDQDEPAQDAANAEAHDRGAEDRSGREREDGETRSEADPDVLFAAHSPVPFRTPDAETRRASRFAARQTVAATETRATPHPLPWEPAIDDDATVEATQVALGSNAAAVVASLAVEDAAGADRAAAASSAPRRSQERQALPAGFEPVVTSDAEMELPTRTPQDTATSPAAVSDDESTNESPTPFRSDRGVALNEGARLETIVGDEAIEHDAQVEAVAQRARRQEAATQVVNRLTLSRGASGSVLHPELGRIEVSAQRHDGEVDVEVVVRDAASAAVIRSAAPQLEQDLRNHSVELRHLDIRGESQDAHDDARGSRAHADPEDRAKRDGQRRAPQERAGTQKAANEEQVRIVL
jgi:Flagellar hook-length control protein FliK